jgi:hypothetical protein
LLPRTTIPLLISLLALAAPAGAIVVSYQATDVADAVPGEDRWVYRYWLDEFPFAAGYGFSVRFDPALYAALDASPATPSAQWDAIAIEPDANLGDDGLYDAEALADAPSVNATFTVSFVWLGEGTPGEQPFDVREPAPSFAVLPGESGTTVLPEPAQSALTAGALASLALRRRITA